MNNVCDPYSFFDLHMITIILEPIAQVKEDDPAGLSAWVREKGLDNHPLFSNCTRNIGQGKRGNYKRIKRENR